MMPEPLSSEQTDAAHRRFAVDCFNECWTHLERNDRTEEDTRVMISLALASRWHWQHVPTRKPENFIRSDGQVSRAYAAARHPNLAMEHALSGLEHCKQHGIGGVDLMCCLEAIARAAALLGLRDKTEQFVTIAREGAQEIEDAETRNLLLKDLEEVEKLQSLNPAR
ncbi:hypothetical protein IT571_11135 [Candidatus Sumerlaeota bacterium]|nr:hypothetical protein [Candidatus Sumerlaeota bacterium]